MSPLPMNQERRPLEESPTDSRVYDYIHSRRIRITWICPYPATRARRPERRRGRLGFIMEDSCVSLASMGISDLWDALNDANTDLHAGGSHVAAW